MFLIYWSVQTLVFMARFFEFNYHVAPGTPGTANYRGSLRTFQLDMFSSQKQDMFGSFKSTNIYSVLLTARQIPQWSHLYRKSQAWKRIKDLETSSIVKYALSQT